MEPAGERATVASLVERLRGHEGARRVLGNATWLLVERALVLAVNFAVGVWLINHLGAELYGSYAYAVSFAALFSALATLGLDAIVVRELSRPGREDEAGAILGTAFLLRAAAAAGTLAVLLGTSALLGDGASSRGLIAVVALSLLAEPANVVDLWFQSRVESRYAVWVRSGVTLLAAGARAALILAGAGLAAFAWLYTGQALAVGVGLVATFVARRPAALALGRSAALARTMLRDAWPLIAAAVSVTIYMRIDRIMLGSLLDATAVGTYSTAATLSEAFNVVPVVLAASLFPAVVRSREGDPARYRRRLQALYDAMGLIGYAVAVPVTFVAAPLIGALFTPEYAAAAPILQLHVWSFPFVALGVARSRQLVAENRATLSMVTTVVGAAANVGLNLALIPSYGGVGAAAATLVSYALAAWAIGAVMPSLRDTVAQQTLALAAPFRPRAVWRGVRGVL